MIEISDLLRFIKNKADEIALDAGQSGSHSDGGASNIKDGVNLFVAGMAFARLPEKPLRDKIPIRWEKYLDELETVADPEWDEYQRLKNKFN